MSPQFPPALYLPDGSSIKEFDEESWESISDDPRGLLLMWEPPKKNGLYKVGLDTAEGVTNWSRGTRTEDDTKVDNSVIEVFHINAVKELMWDEEAERIEDRKNPGARIDRIPLIDNHTRQQKFRMKDVQVAEFAAPCDPVEAARIANIIGRAYKGQDDEQAELILESWPGCGMLAMQELIRVGYGNLWHWEYFADGPAEETKWIGWKSSERSQRLLWMRSRRHIMQRNVVLRSKWLVDEYSNAEVDPNKMRAKASYGYHDDRIQASNMVFWCAHEWTYDFDSVYQEVSESPAPVDFQRFAPTLEDEGMNYRSWRSSACDDWYD